MDGFGREHISMVTNLKELCISQAKAIFYPSCCQCTFDVMHYRRDTLFVARAICYHSAKSTTCCYPTWVYLLEGSSEKGVVAALEDLWNKLQQTMPEEAKDTAKGQIFQV